MKIERIQEALKVRRNDYIKHTNNQNVEFTLLYNTDGSGSILATDLSGTFPNEVRVYSFNNLSGLRVWVREMTPEWQSENTEKDCEILNVR